MQKLDLSFLESIPDPESLTLYLKSQPTRTLHLFTDNPDEFFREVNLLQDNYHTILSFFHNSLENIQKIISNKNEEIARMTNELQTLHISLENHSNMTQHFIELNQKLHERTQLLITRNEELEELNGYPLEKLKSIEEKTNKNPRTKQKNPLDMTEDVEEFLLDFFKKEENIVFLKRNGYLCNCDSKLTCLSDEIEKHEKKNKVLSDDNTSLKTKILNYEKRLEIINKDLHKTRMELKTMKEKKSIYETFKYDFLLDSRPPPQELEIKSACRLTKSLSRLPRFLTNRQKKNSGDVHYFETEPCYLNKNSVLFENPQEHKIVHQHTITLLSDIQKSLTAESFNGIDVEDDDRSIMHSRRKTNREASDEKLFTVSCKNEENRIINFNENNQFLEFLSLVFIYFTGFIMKFKNSVNIKNILLLWPKFCLFLIVFYWMNVYKVSVFCYRKIKN